MNVDLVKRIWIGLIAGLGAIWLLSMQLAAAPLPIHAAPDGDLAFVASSPAVRIQSLADLALVKSGPAGPVAVEASLAYTLAVSNAGPQAAEQVTVTDALPAGSTFVAAGGEGWTCGRSGGTLTCTRAGLAVDTTSTITVGILAPAAAGTITNTATVSSTIPDPDLENNASEVTVDGVVMADLSLAKLGPGVPVYAQGPLTYTLVISNAGPQAADQVAVTDALPPGLTVDSAGGAGWTCNTLGGSVTCTRAELAAGQVATVTLVAMARLVPGTISNTAQVQSECYDPNPGDNADTVDVEVLEVADLALAKSGPAGPVAVEAPVSYGLAVRNAGPQAAKQVAVADALPAGSTFVAAQGLGWSCGESGGTVTCTRAGLMINLTSTITVEILAPAAAGTFTNTATIGATTHDPNLANNASAASVEARLMADVSLSAQGPGAPVHVQGTLTYTLVAGNAGPQAADQVTVTDVLPPGVTLDQAGGAGWTCGHLAGTVTCTRANLAVGEAATITLLAVAPAVPGTVSNAAQIQSAVYDPQPDNNEAAASVDILGVADLGLSMSGPAGPVAVGAVVSYRLVVSNTGLQAAGQVTVTDLLPAGVTFDTAYGSGWICGESAGTVTCARPGLAAGATSVITLQVIAPLKAGTLTNTATVQGVCFDLNSDNDAAEVLVPVRWYQFLPLIQSRTN